MALRLPLPSDAGWTKMRALTTGRESVIGDDRS